MCVCVCVREWVADRERERETTQLFSHHQSVSDLHAVAVEGPHPDQQPRPPHRQQQHILPPYQLCGVTSQVLRQRVIIDIVDIVIYKSTSKKYKLCIYGDSVGSLVGGEGRSRRQHLLEQIMMAPHNQESLRQNMFNIIKYIYQ